MVVRSDGRSSESGRVKPAWRDLSRWSPATLALVLILLGVLPYFNTLFNGFVYDDNTQVMNNPYLRSFRYLREIFTTSVWSYVGILRGTNYYRPMMTLSYLICYQLFGPVAFGFHLTNVVVHTFAICLAYLGSERIFRDRTLALFAAAVFALHPIHTESVAWIAAVTDLQLTLFYLLAFWLFVSLAAANGRRMGFTKLCLVGSFVLALLSKEQALTLPLVATAYEHFYREDRDRTGWGQKLARYGTLWLVAIAYVAFRVRFFGAFAPVLLRPDLSLYQTLLSAVVLVAQYFWKLLWPVELCAFYVFHKSTSLMEPRVLLGVASLILCLALFAVLWRYARPASFGLVWLLLTIGPVLNARWLPANVFTERYLYLPSVGFCWLVAWGCKSLWEGPARWGSIARSSVAAALAVTGAMCFLRIVTRNRDWREDITLYTRTLAAQPDAWPIRNNLGVAYWARGNIAGAKREWLASLQVKADNQIVLSNLGLVATREKRYEEAVQYFQAALKIDPRMTDAHLHLGEVYAAMGLPKLAELQFRDAVALSPLNTEARNLLGRLELDAGRLAEAEEQFTKSVESQPNAGGYNGLGDVYLKRNTLDQAERAFRLALTLDPFDSHAHFRLADLSARGGSLADAAREYEAGFLTDPHNAEALAGVKRLGLKLRDANNPRPSTHAKPGAPR